MDPHQTLPHWRAHWSRNDILYGIEPTSLTVNENCITMGGHTTFLVHFTMVQPKYWIIRVFNVYDKIYVGLTYDYTRLRDPICYTNCSVKVL